MTSSVDGVVSVRDKVVLITGATGLLGSTYSDAFAAAGARLVLLDLPQRRPEEKAADIEARYGTPAMGIAGDVGNEAQIAGLADQIERRFGRLDVALNNAAATPEFVAASSGYFGPFEHHSLASWEAVLKTNLTGPFLICRTVGPLIHRSGGGSVINVSSTYGIVGPHHDIYEGLPFNQPIGYSASKAGVLGLTRWLATYWAKAGIRVNTVTPGGVFNDQHPEFVRRYAAHVPMGRMADRKELVGIMLFLASDASSYCTGQNFVVDGGWTCW